MRSGVDEVGECDDGSAQADDGAVERDDQDLGVVVDCAREVEVVHGEEADQFPALAGGVFVPSRSCRIDICSAVYIKRR